MTEQSEPVSPSSGTPPTEGTLERELRDALEEIRVIATEMGPYSAIRERAWVAIVLLERLRGSLSPSPSPWVDPEDSLADVVFDVVKMIQHARPNVHMGSPEGVQLLVRGLAASGIRVDRGVDREPLADSPSEDQWIRVDGQPPANLDDIAREIHAAWRDGMLADKRPVSQDRLSWDTLWEKDRELDRYIAARVTRLLWAGEPPSLRERIEGLSADAIERITKRTRDVYEANGDAYAEFRAALLQALEGEL